MGGRWVQGCAAGILVVSPMIALASGRIPASSTVKPFASAEACLAALQDLAVEDRRQVAPKTVAADGRTREVSLDTHGVESTGQAGGRYEAALWWHNGTPRADRPKVETSHSYRHRVSECDRRILRITGEDGYTQSTFSPAAPPDAPR